jgi:hypothetical protein
MFLPEKYSNTGRTTHSFSSRLMQFLREYYRLMFTGSTHKMAALTKNGPFWINVIFPRNPSINGRHIWIESI